VVLGRPEGLDGALLRAGSGPWLPAIVFSEHLDHTVWTVALDELDPDHHLVALSTPEGLLTPPAFDTHGYPEAIERCRERFPDLRILSGLEIGEPHWHAEAAAKVLGVGRFDRVLGSLHCLPDGEGFAEPPGLYGHWIAAEVVRKYLAEVVRLVTESDIFSVLAHIDYPVRHLAQARGRPIRSAGVRRGVPARTAGDCPVGQGT
jgi:histidinol-phosphatase (PHP family)